MTAFAEMLGGALTRMQVDGLYDRLNSANSTIRELRFGENLLTDEASDDALEAIDYDLSDIRNDLLKAMTISSLRECGAERVARAARNVHLKNIAEAEQLLASARTGATE